MRRILVAAAALALCFAAGAQELRAATAAQTRAALAAEDDWTAALSPFHRAAAVGAAGDVAPALFRARLQQVARDCEGAEVQRWQAAFAQVAPRFLALHMRLPAVVTLACTTGADAAGRPYTRGAAVFMPPLRAQDPGHDTFLMAHELFHIYSRYNPSVASALYRVIGFRDAPLLAWPDEWRDARIANPDAPFDRHTMDIEMEGSRYTVMPVLVARRTALQPGETFFDVLDTRLLAVESAPDGRSSVPLRGEGKLVWFDAQGTPSYLRQLGGNTGYVIHPEETTADNIAFLVTGTRARNPALLEAMRQVLSKAKSP